MAQDALETDMDTIHEVSGVSPDFRTELAAQLARLVPEAVADGTIDIDTLTELLGGDASGTAERFGLFWPGKKRAMRAAQLPTSATLRPEKGKSRNWDSATNAFIEGDNLEVLKVLQKHYHGRIKLIYIDPPYNTGHDFIYSDNFKDGITSYLGWSQQTSSDGKKLSTNAESEGRYHSNWLNMLYPRLKLARNLLTPDGYIAISIDDSELSNLVTMCREIFGEDNVINTIPVKSSETSGVKMSHVDKRLPKIKEYVVLCTRDHTRASLNRVDVPKSGSDDGALDKYLKYYNKIIINPSAPAEEWTLASVKDAMVEQGLPTTADAVREFKVENADRVVYRTNNASLSDMSFDTPIARVTSPTGIEYVWWEGKQMLFLSDYLKESLCDLWTDISTINLNKETNGVKGFRNGQKPLKLLQRILALTTRPESNDIVLDFFAGSGSTGHAVMKQNSEDGGNRRFILVQLPEPLHEKNKEQKEGYKFCTELKLEPTISSLSRERVRRAAEEFDAGFRSYTLADTNFKKWQPQPGIDAETLSQTLIDLRGSSNDNADPEDLLVEILLKQGRSLVESIRDIDIDDLPYTIVGEQHAAAGEDRACLLLYLNEHVKPSVEQLRAAVATAPAEFIILEDAFQGDDELKTNVVQICATHNVELRTV